MLQHNHFPTIDQSENDGNTIAWLLCQNDKLKQQKADSDKIADLLCFLLLICLFIIGCLLLQGVRHV